jgi:uncharacterized protein YecE (DUF72 family)
MHVHVGTSGFSYKEWKGSFYPADLKNDQMLRYYAERLDTVEINNTFYRMPNPDLLGNWAEQVGEAFRFVLKAPQRITHQKRLANIDEDVTYFFATAQRLGMKLGPVLFQLPPYSKKDVPRLEGLLKLIPAGQRIAVEFRHESWLAPDVYERLHDAGAALCIADSDEEPLDSIHATCDWGYLRLRRVEYDDAAMQAWADRVLAQPWKDAFVFFKHEDEGTGPRFAAAFRERLNR